MTLDEKKLEAIAQALYKCDGLAVAFKNGPMGRYRFEAGYVLEALSQLEPKEQLEVHIVVDENDGVASVFVNETGLIIAIKNNEQSAIDFCKRHGLKIKNETSI